MNKAMDETKKDYQDVDVPSPAPFGHGTRMPPVDIEFCDLTYTVQTGRTGQTWIIYVQKYHKRITYVMLIKSPNDNEHESWKTMK